MNAFKQQLTEAMKDVVVEWWAARTKVYSGSFSLMKGIRKVQYSI